MSYVFTPFLVYSLDSKKELMDKVSKFVEKKKQEPTLKNLAIEEELMTYDEGVYKIVLSNCLCSDNDTQNDFNSEFFDAIHNGDGKTPYRTFQKYDETPHKLGWTLPVSIDEFSSLLHYVKLDEAFTGLNLNLHSETTDQNKVNIEAKVWACVENEADFYATGAKLTQLYSKFQKLRSEEGEA